jgi:hypothetical protein
LILARQIFQQIRVCIKGSTKAMESTLYSAMCQTGFRPPVRLSIFNGFNDVLYAKWLSFLAVNTPSRATSVALYLEKELSEASALVELFLTLLIVELVLELLPYLDQVVIDAAQLGPCWVSKRSNRLLSIFLGAQ